MSEDRDSVLIEFLDRLERQEERLLAWGVVDGAFVADELFDHAEAFLTERSLWKVFSDPDELVELLQDRQLLFHFLEGTNSRWRTRMAEAVRLVSKLRQLFPGRPWQRTISAFIVSQSVRITADLLLSGCVRAM